MSSGDYAKLSYTAAPAQTDFAINWPFLERQDVVAKDDGVVIPSSQYTFQSSDTILRLNTPASGGELITIVRETALHPALPVFQNDTGFPADILNRLVKRLSFAAEENAYNVNVLEALPPGRQTLLWDSNVSASWGAAEINPIIGEVGMSAAGYAKILIEWQGFILANGPGIVTGTLQVEDGSFVGGFGQAVYSYHRASEVKIEANAFGITVPLGFIIGDAPNSNGMYGEVTVHVGVKNEDDVLWEAVSHHPGSGTGGFMLNTLRVSGMNDGRSSSSENVTHMMIGGLNDSEANIQWDLTSARARIWGIT